ncbi:MAG: hypothetical protein CL912_33380 [Deltaproteobacteria bacterium]|nr:hypothetical protein [Deltaproteobacteria bacterium]
MVRLTKEKLLFSYQDPTSQSPTSGRTSSVLLRLVSLAFPKDDFPLLTRNKRGLNNGTYFVPMGRVVGGRSTINAMFFLRYPAVDYDSWEKLGNRGWGWQGFLPYFKKVRWKNFSETRPNC